MSYFEDAANRRAEEQRRHGDDIAAAIKQHWDRVKEKEDADQASAAQPGRDYLYPDAQRKFFSFPPSHEWLPEWMLSGPPIPNRPGKLPPREQGILSGRKMLPYLP